MNADDSCWKIEKEEKWSEL